MTIIYHNPKCSKSRQTLTLLEENNIKHSVKLYLENPPTEEDIQNIINKLGFNSARQLMRTGETIYKELNLSEQKDEYELIKAMHNNPILIERPIVIVGDKAKIGRPPESILVLF